MSLFVDTSFWYAAADKSDASNSHARVILSSGEQLVTTDHILIETWTLIRHRLGRRAAERFWEGLRSGAATVETVGRRTWTMRGKSGNPIATRTFRLWTEQASR